MAVITSGNIKVQSELDITGVLNLDMDLKAGSHGTCTLRGYLRDGEMASKTLCNATDLKVRVMGAQGSNREKNTPLFHGIVKDAHIFMENGHHQIILCLVTASELLDRKKSSRSFQDVSATYQAIVEQVLTGQGDAAAIFDSKAKEKTGEPIIQYEETDWQFFNRLASHIHIPVIPDCITGKANFWFGMPRGKIVPALLMTEYSAGVSKKYHEMPDSHLARGQFIYYTIKETANYQIGDEILVKGTPCTIYEKKAELVKGELIFSYIAGKEGNWYADRQEQDRLIGLELAGEVVETQKETVNLKLDIDGGKGRSEYAWSWAPSSGNVMYCMPKKGTKARLCFGTGRASSGLAEGGIRDNGGAGGTCQGMSDSQNRTFVTEHGKKMELFPEQLCFQGQDMLRAFLDDQKGIFFQSHKTVDMIAADQISLNGQFINAVTPQEINMYRNARKAAEKATGIQPKGSRNPATGGGGDSGFTLSNEFNALAKVNILCGTDIIEYNYFEDDIDEELYVPEVIQSDMKKKLLWGLAAVVAVAAVAAIVTATVFTGGAAAVCLVGGLALLCGTAAVVTTAQSDDGSLSVLDYVFNGIEGAIQGAFAAAAFLLVPFAAETLVSIAVLPGMPGIVLGGKFISSTILLGATMTPMGILTGLNLFGTFFDANEVLNGKNPMKELFKDHYGDIRYISAAASMMIFWLGISNPNAYNSRGGNKPVQEIKNRYPKEAQQGKKFNFKIKDGRIILDNGIKEVDFVIDMDGNLHIGRGHSYLANGKPVQAAGTIKVDSMGNVRRITNQSGHYTPTVSQTNNYEKIFNNAGIKTKNAWLEIYQLELTKSGYVNLTQLKKVISKKLK